MHVCDSRSFTLSLVRFVRFDEATGSLWVSCCYEWLCRCLFVCLCIYMFLRPCTGLPACFHVHNTQLSFCSWIQRSLFRSASASLLVSVLLLLSFFPLFWRALSHTPHTHARTHTHIHTLFMATGIILGLFLAFCCGKCRKAPTQASGSLFLAVFLVSLALCVWGGCAVFSRVGSVV